MGGAPVGWGVETTDISDYEDWRQLINQEGTKGEANYPLPLWLINKTVPEGVAEN